MGAVRRELVTRRGVIKRNIMSERKISKPRIGFIGQGYVGKNYADDFEKRGFEVVRYALEESYRGHRDEIRQCDIVFIAVPTPTTPDGFDASILDSVMELVGKGKTAVIKSTIVPGTTEKIQSKYPDIFVLHSPEFLTEATAALDAAEPQRNIIGIPNSSPEHRLRAERVMAILPKAPFTLITTSREAEFLKYANNVWFYAKVVLVNVFYDLAAKLGLDWDHIRDALAADPRIGRTHLDPVHKSGRGAGGSCFIKDFEAFFQFHADTIDDPLGRALLQAVREKNLELLRSTKKDLALIERVYGKKP